MILGSIGVLRSRVGPKRGTDVIGHTHITIGFPIGHFLLVVLWNQASISNDFQDTQWRM